MSYPVELIHESLESMGKRERTLVELMKYYEISKKRTTYCKLYEPIYKLIKS